MLGKLVLDVLCDGCMAHVHKLERVGEIIAIDDQRAFFGQGEHIIVAKCRVVNSREDLPEEFFYPALADGGFQPLNSGSFGQALGYIWRH